jgi:hypothetical protein
MRTTLYILSIALLTAFSTSAAVFYEEDFELLPGTATVKASDGKIRFGGNAAGQPSISSNEYAVGTIGDGTGVSLVDDGSGTNNVLFVDGRYDKTYGGAVVIDPSAFGGAAGVARLSFDLTYYLRKGGDGTECYVDVYAASGYDLNGATDAKIVMDLKNGKNVPTTVLGVNGSASATLLETLPFDHNTALGNLDLSFNYDGSNAIVVVWESQYKSSFMVDNIQITEDGVIAEEGDSDVVFFGGDAGIFTGDATINNQFVGQTGAGQILQWNGVGDGSGQLHNLGIGATLTNTLNDLVLTTVDILPSGSNTFSFGAPNILGITGSDNGKFNTILGEAWTFEFNKDVWLNQLVLTALDFDGETVRVTVDGVDTNSFNRLDANMTNLAWEATANKYVYTYAAPVLVPAGTDITIDGTSGAWALQGLVVNVPSFFETLNIIDFGGNPSDISNATYQAEVAESDAIIAWWGGDNDGRSITNGVGTLKDQGIGATLSSVNYGVTITTLGISSSDPDRTNTVVSGGCIGINTNGSGASSFDAADDTEWTFEFNKDVYLSKTSFRYFLGAKEAQIIIGGVTNSILPTDCVAATYDPTFVLYSFPSPVFIPAGTDITVRSGASSWWLGNLLVGFETPDVSFDTFALQYGLSGNKFDDNDSDGLVDFAEYVFGGNPTNGFIDSTNPTFDTATGDYVYSVIGDDSFTATVVTTDNLVHGNWVTNGSPMDITSTSGELEVHTNAVGTTETELFIKLLVE